MHMSLSVRDLVAGYGNKTIVRGASLDVAEKQVVSLIGHNGAGKTTLLNALFGLLPVRSGDVIWNGRSITKNSPVMNVKSGLSYSPTGPQIYPRLTIRENLELGGFAVSAAKENIRRIFDLFPILLERQNAKAGTLSGGERQMLAMGAVMVAGPKMVIFDEPSGGLAPMMVTRLFDTIRRLVDEFGVSFLVVEQNTKAAFRISDRVYVMTQGTIVGQGSVAELQGTDRLLDLFLGGETTKVD
jgi:branched-chain amino acid transport system ATP-binding protein